MDKRGQLYLLAALLIGFIIFIVVTPANQVKETVIEDNFQDLARNFETESAKFLNAVIEKNADVSKAFLNFTVLFSSYAKTKNPDFGLLYLFLYNNKLYVGNYLQDPINIMYHGSYTLNGCFSHIKAGFSIAGLSISVPSLDLSLVQRCQLVINAGASSIVDLVVQEPGNHVSLKVDLAQGNPDIVIVAREKKGRIQKVYTKGKLL